jgi:Zn-dependent alcohol dehydrogenase
VLRLHADGRLRVDHLVSSQRPLSEVNAAFDDLRAGRGLRSVLRPDWT